MNLHRQRLAGARSWPARRFPEIDLLDRASDLLDRASALFARGVRRGLVAEASHAAAPPSDAPGVLEFDASGRLERASSTAEPLLEELSGTSAKDGWRSPAVQAVASATRQAIVARASTLPSSAVKTPAGTWLVLHGALLGERGIAVFLQRAHPTLVAPLLLKAYGLTAREQEVTQWLLRGATAAQAGQRLAISTHTVNEHGNRSTTRRAHGRAGELSATVFFGEHLPRIQSQVAVGDDPSFVDAPRPRAGNPAPRQPRTAFRLRQPRTAFRSHKARPGDLSAGGYQAACSDVVLWHARRDQRSFRMESDTERGPGTGVILVSRGKSGKRHNGGIGRCR